MEIGEKERQIKALRLAREARWKANAKAPIPQSSATLEWKRLLERKHRRNRSR